MVIDPSEISRLLIAFFAAAMLIAAGVLYAVLLTLARRHNSKTMRNGAVFAYLILACFVALLAWAANLSGPWLILVGLMLLGHLFMPRAILRLCEATHMLEHEGEKE